MANDPRTGHRHGNAQYSDRIWRTSVSCESDHGNNIGRDGYKLIETSIKAKPATYSDGET